MKFESPSFEAPDKHDMANSKFQRERAFKHAESMMNVPQKRLSERKEESAQKIKEAGVHGYLENNGKYITGVINGRKIYMTMDTKAVFVDHVQLESEDAEKAFEKYMPLAAKITKEEANNAQQQMVEFATQQLKEIEKQENESARINSAEALRSIGL